MESLFSWRGWRSREKSLCILSLDNYKSDGVWVQRPVGCKDSLWRLSDEVVYFFIITNCLRHREENTAVSEQQIQVTFLTEGVPGLCLWQNPHHLQRRVISWVDSWQTSTLISCWLTGFVSELTPLNQIDFLETQLEIETTPKPTICRKQIPALFTPPYLTVQAHTKNHSFIMQTYFSHGHNHMGDNKIGEWGSFLMGFLFWEEEKTHNRNRPRIIVLVVHADRDSDRSRYGEYRVSVFVNNWREEAICIGTQTLLFHRGAAPQRRQDVNLTKCRQVKRARHVTRLFHHWI